MSTDVRRISQRRWPRGSHAENVDSLGVFVSSSRSIASSFSLRIYEMAGSAFGNPPQLLFDNRVRYQRPAMVDGFSQGKVANVCLCRGAGRRVLNDKIWRAASVIHCDDDFSQPGREFTQGLGMSPPGACLSY
jgi:hypothetical protein